MTLEQEQELTKKLERLNYPDFDILPSDEGALMIYIDGHLICSVSHALSLSDEDLKALVY